MQNEMSVEKQHSDSYIGFCNGKQARGLSNTQLFPYNRAVVHYDISYSLRWPDAKQLDFYDSNCSTCGRGAESDSSVFSTHWALLESMRKGCKCRGGREVERWERGGKGGKEKKRGWLCVHIESDFIEQGKGEMRVDFVYKYIMFES